MVQPIGIAVVGGLTSSTFVTLLVIPVLYSVVMRKKPKKSRLQKALEGSNNGSVQESPAESKEQAETKAKRAAKTKESLND